MRWLYLFSLWDTLTKNPAILYQGVPFFCSFARFSAYLDEKTEISLLRCTKASASRCESRGQFLLKDVFIIPQTLFATASQRGESIGRVPRSRPKLWLAATISQTAPRGKEGKEGTARYPPLDTLRRALTALCRPRLRAGKRGATQPTLSKPPRRAFPPLCKPEYELKLSDIRSDNLPQNSWI